MGVYAMNHGEDESRNLYRLWHGLKTVNILVKEHSRIIFMFTEYGNKYHTHHSYVGMLIFHALFSLHVLNN